MKKPKWFFFQFVAVNYENRVGAVGFIPVIFPNILPLGLIQVDKETGKEIRGDDG